MANNYTTITVQQVMDKGNAQITAAQATAATATSSYNTAVAAASAAGTQPNPDLISTCINALQGAQATIASTQANLQLLQSFVDTNFFAT